MPFDVEFLAVPLLFVGQIACILGFVVVAVVVAYTTRRARTRAWEELSFRHGLTLEPGSFFVSPRLTGGYRGHQLTLDTFTRRTGKSSTIYTRIVLFVNNQDNVYFALYEEGVFSKIGKFFGSEDVQIGDEEVDRRFIIKSRPEGFAVRVFTSIGLRSRLLQARRLNIEVDGRELYFEQVGSLTDAEYLQFLFDLLSEMADFVERG
jgi:hypothetical protein